MAVPPSPGLGKFSKRFNKMAPPPSPPSCDSSSDDSSDDEHQRVKRQGPGGNIVFVPAVDVKKSKHISPQDAIDEFWVKFNSKTPGKASTVLPKNLYTTKAGKKASKPVTRGKNAVASYEEAAALCKAKVAKIVKECRRVNQKYRDPHFDIEFDLKWGKGDCLQMLENTSEKLTPTFSPGSVKRVGDIFDNPQFYVSGATANDIRQGRDGDCWFMAALCTLGNKPGLIEKVCVARDENIGVYGFVFHRDGEWRSEIIDDKLYLTKPDYDESWIERNLIEDRQRINSEEDYRKIYQSNSGALYFAQCEDPNETWLPLLEKAYAKAHGDYAAIEGGFTGEGLEDLTGGVTTEIFSTDILDKEYFWKEELLKVNKDFLFGCAAGIFCGRGYRKGIYEGHAYSVLRAVEMDGQRLVLLRNPWGEGEWKGAWSDGSKEWTPEWMKKLEHRFGDDGSFWMSYDDLLKKFQTFDRTRLFTEEWKVTQSWASMEVPWTVSYHDTKFSFTLDNAAPVMIVLSQLDSRYFCGLEGQYRFELSFRIHQAGEEDYIVRSHGNYWMRRSVTAELELPAGEYDVLMKVKAFKDGSSLPVEDVVRNNAKKRRDKLSRIGLSYDLAHAKGIVKETPEEKKARKEAEEKRKNKARKEVKERLMKEKKKRVHNENKEKRKIQEKKIKRMAKAKTKKAKKAAQKSAEKEAKRTIEHVARVFSEQSAKEAGDTDPKAEVKVVEGKFIGTEAKDNGKTESDVTSSDQASDTEKPAIIDVATSEGRANTTTIGVPANTETGSKSKEDKIIQLKAINVDFRSALATNPSASVSTSTTVTHPPKVPIDESDDSDDSDDSDLESICSDISDISVGVLDDIIEAENKAIPPPPTTNSEEEDEFEKDPWNAVLVVGLRVYSKESAVTVRVKRERKWEEPLKKKKKRDIMGEEMSSDEDEDEDPMEVGEKKLDVDDSAADAADKAVEFVVDTPIEERMIPIEEDGEGKDNDSESSSVVVV
ncbi:25a5be1b-f331-47d8-a488-368a5033da88 [Sclerotinia trifoliorum]|uniref:25a5be1b-f331-47d8-a488-368a5033da88 n=1 Tax=Sclerotinia trifoliorum TaxID=28548 RepID=A0A8H2ZNJ4_9HELO|nr:25a5be1b-f331-47d8-a488-368a5033da88 [Sclerotinia trifoliorum]